MAKPIVAITMGDPAGVGPEVILKALADREVRRACYPLIVGDIGILQRAQKNNRRRIRLAVKSRGEPILRNSAIPVYSVSKLSPQRVRPGRPTKLCGEAAYRYICTAVDLVHSGTAAAMATAPINKKVLRLAGYSYPGHTELLAKLTGTRECRMMLLGPRLKVILVTVHVPLQRVARLLSAARVRKTLELTHRGLRQWFRIPRPKIAVTGLNPHAGEDGIFGADERQAILPAIKQARKMGIRVHGPFAADSLFYKAARGEYDAVVCMYHDQGLIPLKLLHFFGGVGLTLGLPIIRTSVDHGTAYDIAGQSRADASSMKQAIILAARLARQKRRV